MISRTLAEYDEDVRAEWARIRIDPEKWRCDPWGREGGGFWAVAINDGRVLWLNDIEDGFNWSPFSERGTIGAYTCNQDAFTLILEGIAQAQSKRAWATLGESDVPTELRGPGTIVSRQTTYWEVRTSTRALYRAHFRDKVEFAFATADYFSVQVVTRHPLLAEYEEPSRSLYFSGVPLRSHVVAVTIDRTIREISEGWRDLARYAGGIDRVEKLLNVGHGLLMEAPQSVCDEVAAILHVSGIGSSILGHAPSRRGKRVLLLGSSYVMAGSFTFERREPRS